MAHYYDPATSSFFDTATHAQEQIPESAVKITLAQKRQLLEGERTGFVIAINHEGSPVLEQPEPDPEAPARFERAWRDQELARVAWVRDRHRDELALGLATTITANEFSELLAYMQALRDWPASPGFPGASDRPVPPAVVSPM